MAGSPEQAPKPPGCGCRPFWDITVFIVLVFILWMERDRIAPAASELRSEIAPLIGRIVVTAEPTPTIDSPLAPAAIGSTAPIASETKTPAPTITAIPTRSATGEPFLIGDFKNGLWLEQNDPNLVSAIRGLFWAQDGVTMAEQKAIQGLIYVSVGSRRLASSLIARNWVRDGIDRTEADLIDRFAYLAREDPNTAEQILRMPFLKGIEPPDVSAIESLGRLALTEPQTLGKVLSHPVLRDGISDQLTPIIATLHGVARTNPSLAYELLNPGTADIEWRTVTLPLSGDVILSIIRTGPGAARSMDLLEHAVRGAEEHIGVPLPTNYIGLLFEDAVQISSAGTNFGTHIAIRPEFDVGEDTGRAAYFGLGIAHEVAHYYWSGNADWIDEGAADFMAAFIEIARTGRALVVGRGPCAYADSISELESLKIERGGAEFECNYSLGIRMFMDLYRTLGAERFRRGFRALYLASTMEDDAGGFRGTSLGIGHVKEAFRTVDGAESVVFARWYDGTEPYDLSRVDRSQVDHGLPSINGRVDDAYLTAGANGPRVSTFSAQGTGDSLVLNLKYSHSLSGGPVEMPLEIVEYYQDGFVLRRQGVALTAKPRSTGGTARFLVGIPASHKWVPGHYAVFVYAGGRKVAEVYYEVTP